MRSRTLRFTLALVAIAAGSASTVTGRGQARPPVTLADYGKFETLVTQTRAGLSPDGRWLEAKRPFSPMNAPTA